MEKMWSMTNVSKQYHIKAGQEISALDDIDLDIYKGEVFGLIGESGSGKTTLGKVIIGIIEPTEGKIYFKGRDIAELRGKELLGLRRESQIIFQNPYRSLNPRMRVAEMVMEGVKRDAGRVEQREMVRDLLQMVGIDIENMDNYPHQFSGGERQRIAIARALSTSPSFIVCDEPTSNLDLSVQAKILNLFMELKDRLNLTYLFISHNIKVVNFIVDRVAVMYKGKIVEYGKKEDVMKNPLHPYTSLLISSSFLKKTDIAKKDTPDKKGCAFYPLCLYAEDMCAKCVPEMKETTKGHFVACLKRI
ncbi:MAG: ABC transporter ATP-binding protein [Elusimicrobia bacterium]|nr:ABC transporter ATP-binding protein [Elusimicrobiota bacterium]